MSDNAVVNLHKFSNFIIKFVLMKNDKPYIPAPADISGIRLPDSLSELTEEIAENVHEVWARSRMDEGWTYGPERNDTARTHPCLVPYGELSETEKDYDRNTAVSTLKLIISLGYTINKNTRNE